MTKYRIVYSDSMFILQEEVEYLLSQGWQCQGGVSVFLQPAGYTQIVMYAQAVINHEEVEPCKPEQPLAEIIV